MSINKLIIRCFFSFILLFMSVVYAQNSQFSNQFIMQDPNATYRLFSCPNNFYTIKLNTQDGRMWLLCSTSASNDVTEKIINEKKLSQDGKNGRWTIYEYYGGMKFYLLDTVTGNVKILLWDAQKNKIVFIP